MRKGLFNSKDIQPACKLCSYGTIVEGDDCVLCEKTGIRMPNSKCSRFKYDPLKRVPLRKMKTGGFSKEDFEL